MVCPEVGAPCHTNVCCTFELRNMLAAPCIQCLPYQLESFTFEIALEKLCLVLVRVKQLCFAQLTKCESTVPP